MSGSPLVKGVDSKIAQTEVPHSSHCTLLAQEPPPVGKDPHGGARGWGEPRPYLQVYEWVGGVNKEERKGQHSKRALILGTEGSQEMQIPGPCVWFCDSLGLGLELGITILFYFFNF